MDSTTAGRAALRVNKPAPLVASAALQPEHQPAAPASHGSVLPQHPSSIPSRSEQEMRRSLDQYEPGIALPLQRKLAVGSVSDPLEDEADRVAEQVMRMTTPSKPHRCSCGGTPGPDGECAACKAKRLARMAITRAAPAPQSAPPSVAAALSGTGRPLDAATRAFFEPRLSANLDMVRVHDDASAAGSAHDVAAHAYTVGRDVVFGAGLYQPGTDAGRALLAHELAHVVQQEGGRAAPGIQRKPRTFTVHPDHAPLTGEEVLILMAMASRGVDRAHAIELIKNDEYGCGEHPACLHGVTDTSPIEFTIGPNPPEKKHPAPAKKAAAKKAVPPPVVPGPDPDIDFEDHPPPVPLPAEIESALDDPLLKRFFAVGIQDKYLQLPQGQPSPDDYVAVNYIRDQILRLDAKELTCYRMFAAEESMRTWTDIAKSLHEFSSQKADLCHAGEFPDAAPLERLRGDDALYAAIKRREKLDTTPDYPTGAASFLPGGDDNTRHLRDALIRERSEAHRDLDLKLTEAGFASLDDFDKAANDFRLYFRANALRIAERMLFESGRVLQDAIHRYGIQGDTVPKDCLELYDELYRSYGGRPDDQLKNAHPILRNPAALHAVREAKSPYEFSWRLTLFAHERLRDLDFVQSNLRRKPDVVFRFDAVVKATFDDLGLTGQPLYEAIIREQRGKPGDSLFDRLVSLGIDLLLFALSFADLPIALTAAVAKATYDTGAQAIDFQEQSRAADQGFREQPSIAPVIITPIVELAPYGVHGAVSALKGLGGAAGVESKVATAGVDQLAAGADSEVGQATAHPDNAPAVDPDVDLAPPKAPPAPDVAPVAADPAAPVADAVDSRVAQSEQRLADAQAKAGAAGSRLDAAGARAAEAEQTVSQAEADLAQARQEAKTARANRARTKKAYDKAKPGSKAAPRAEYTAAKNAADKAEKKVASAAKRVSSAKQARGEVSRAVRRGQTAVDRAQEAVTEAENQHLIELEADRLRNLPKNIEDLPQGWDYEQFPKGPKRAWRPGDAINMPNAKGDYPVWGTIRKRIWMTRATDEIAERAAGRHVREIIPPRPAGPTGPGTGVEVEIPKGGLPWLDPIREATDKELAEIASSGSMPGRLGAEIEHARIPQRAGGMLEEVGVDPNTARRVTKVGDPDNLMPTRKEIHAIVDEPARVINPNRNPTLEFSLDVRANAPFREATDQEIGDIVKAIKDSGVDLGKTQTGLSLRAFLQAEKDLRPSSTWEVP